MTIQAVQGNLKKVTKVGAKAAAILKNKATQILKKFHETPEGWHQNPAETPGNSHEDPSI